MKTTQIKLLNSHEAIRKLVNLQLPLKKSYAIYKLIKELDANREFYALEEQKLIAESGAVIDEGGRIEFNDAGAQIKFMQARNELNGLEVELQYEPITLTEGDLGDAGISPADIMCLEDLIIFE